MPKDDQPEQAAPQTDDAGDAPGTAEEPAGRRARRDPRPSRVGSQVAVLTVTGVVIAVLLAVGVVVAALQMKFEADQARWQQRQTCLEWYRLQAEYGLGPWYEKLPEAAADCGGEVNEDGDPMVPGGTAPALSPDDVPESTTTTSPSTTTTAPPFTSVPPPVDGTGGP